MNKIIKKNILTVCHDAGGAEVISAYVGKNVVKANFICLVAGPAVKVFKRKKLDKFFITGKRKPGNIFVKFKNIDLVLTGTNWSSALGRDFIQEGKNRGIKTVVYLDHWTNYRERFGYPRPDWQNNLPHEIWAGDKHSYFLAKKYFKELSVKLVPNCYFQEIKDEYKKSCSKGKNAGNGILLVCEPMSEKINVDGDKNKIKFTEYEILRKLLDFFADNKTDRPIIVRLHPSEKKDKFDDILANYERKLKISKSCGKDILSDLQKCSDVIGAKSMALVIARLCGKRVFSFDNFRDINNFLLPFKGIKIIKRIEDLIKQIKI
jgi:hypothetical protein